MTLRKQQIRVHILHPAEHTTHTTSHISGFRTGGKGSSREAPERNTTLPALQRLRRDKVVAVTVFKCDLLTTNTEISAEEQRYT